MGLPVVALAFSLLACAGSLYLSLGLGLVACPLCFYQRTFAFGLVGVLLVGLLSPERNPNRLCVLALPLAVGGFGIAAFHTYLVLSHKLECPLGVAEFRTAPEQSLFVYTLIVITLVIGALREVRTNSKTIPAFLLAVVLGFVSAYCGFMPGVNPSPKQADKPLSDPRDLKTCQKPFA